MTIHITILLDNKHISAPLFYKAYRLTVHWSEGAFTRGCLLAFMRILHSSPLYTMIPVDRLRQWMAAWPFGFWFTNLSLRRCCEESTRFQSASDPSTDVARILARSAKLTLPLYITSLLVRGANSLLTDTLPSKLYKSMLGSSTTTSTFCRAVIDSMLRQEPISAPLGCFVLRLVSPSRAMVSMYAMLFSPLLSNSKMSAGIGSSRSSLMMSPTCSDCL